METKININEKEFTIVRESTSNKNASAYVDGSIIRIRIPLRWPKEESLKSFIKLQKRIIKKLEKNLLYFTKPKPLTFRAGQNVFVLEKSFILIKENGNGNKTSSAKLLDDKVIVKLCKDIPQEDEESTFSNLSRRAMASALHRDVETRIRTLNEMHFQARLSKVFIKENITNFGSCSSKGNINISFRVLFAPIEVLDYVIIHELAHLKEHNHSKAFWALVEKIVPNYKTHRKWLRENKHNLGLNENLDANTARPVMITVTPPENEILRL